MKKRLFYLVALCVLGVANVFATDYYVATDGSDSNSGTSIDAPLAKIATAISKVSAGDAIFVRAGKHSYSDKITISKNGTASNPIRLEAYQSEDVILDFSGTSFGTRAISLSGNYWVIKGLRVHKAGDNGMFISGSNNIVEHCEFFANKDTGLQLASGASSNQIINCDSYGNADPSDYGDADGFACKMDVGNNNSFKGCRAWLNVDDGWDGYLRGADNVTTTLENCWTWMNGYFLDGTDGGAAANGNGFKVGGSDNKDLAHNFTLTNCVAFDNKSKGFDQNNNKGNMKFYNCTGYRNIGANYSIYLDLNTGKTAEVKNCIAVDGNVSLQSFVIEQTNSWSSGVTFSNSDFISLDTTGVSGPRKADGSLPDLDLFKLKASSSLIDAGTDLEAGILYNGIAPDLGAFETSSGPVYTFSSSKIGNGSIAVSRTGSVFEEGTVISLTATPLKGETFNGWTGDVVSSSASINVTIDSDKSVTANFSSVTQPILVAYVTDPNGANYGNDTQILPALKEEGSFIVTEIDATTSGNDYSSYDLVVITEVPNSAAEGMLELKGIDKPLVMMKVHSYKTATGTWGWCSTGYGQNDTETNVVVSNTSHPIFNGVTFVNGNEVNILSSVVSSKGLTYMDPTTFTSGGSSVASLASVKNNASSISIFEIGKGATISGTTLTEDFIQIGINSTSFSSVTEDGVKIVLNACHYLTDGLSTGVEAQSPNNCSITQLNDQLIVESNGGVEQAVVEIYTINGQKVYGAVVNEQVVISLSSLTKGLYVVTLQSKEGVITKKIVIN